MSSQPAASPLPTPDERTMAMVSCLLSAFTGFIGPLIILIVKRDSLYVKLYALESLLWHLGYMAITFVCIFGFFFTMIFAGGFQPTHAAAPPPMFFLFPFLWLFMMAGWVVNLVLGIIGALKANEGVWWRYPITGRLAEKFLGVQG